MKSFLSHTQSVLQRVCFVAVTLSFGLVSLKADGANQSRKDRSTHDRKGTQSHEIHAEYGYVAGADMELGSSIGDVSEQNSLFRYVVVNPISEIIFLRLGAGTQRFSFGLPNAAPLPNTLQSVAAIIGADFSLSDQWLMRLEIEPGIYSDFHDLSEDDVNAPFIAGFSYLVNEDLQWVFGMSVDARREIPVLPAVGARWRFADRWTLMAILPKPRLEYELTEALKLYGGLDLKAGTYKVAENFGSTHGRPNLNNATIDYTELRTGLGLAWRLFPALTMDLEGGYMPYREFDFHTADTRVKSDGGAPYGQIALKAEY